MRYKDENAKLVIFERWQLKSGEAVKTRNNISNHHTEQWTNENTKTRWKATLTFVRSWSIGLFARNKENKQTQRESYTSDNSEEGLEMTQWNFE